MLIISIFSSNSYAKESHAKDYSGTSQTNKDGRINESNRSYVDKRSTENNTYSPSYSSDCPCFKHDTSACGGWDNPDYTRCYNNAPCIEWAKRCN